MSDRVSFWARLFAGTIWDRTLLEEVPERFRALYTVVLPVKYFFFFLFGAVGALAKAAPSLARVVTVSYVDVWTVCVGAFALVALIGLVSRRFRLEMYATILLDVLLLSYPVALITLGIGGDEAKLSLGLGLLVFVMLPAWRVVDIVRTERRRNE